MAQFEIKNLTFAYPEREAAPALNNVNFTVEKGEYIVICGKSGSGKTTLLRHLKNVLTPHGVREGEILYDGTPISEIDFRKQSAEIGYVMQDPDSQIVTDKVWHELAFGLENLGVEQEVMRLRVAEMASYFGISSWFHKSTDELSGGQKQLLNLASVMAMQPKVLILDEPTSQLDPIAASDFLNTVRKINSEIGTTIIITEHRLEDVLYAADKVILMENGKITACDKPEKMGTILSAAQSDMYEAMPVPVKVFHAVEKDITNSCPLTVRDGRSWLSKKSFAEDAILDADKLKNADINPVISYDEIAVRIKELYFRYEKNQKDVLKGASLEIPKGIIFALAGGNGSGKTTFLKAISGIIKPYSGKIYIGGKPIAKYKSGELYRKNVAMLPQDPKSLFIKKTVYDELYEMVDGKMSDSDKEKMISKMAELCEISHLFDRHPYDLSGGEQQRTALAKVLLTEPQILLLDEPTKGMDSYFKKSFGQLLRRLRDGGTTIIMVSHDVEFTASYADLAGLFFDGDIITVNTARRFFAGNSFYTTAASRMSRDVFENAVTDEDVIRLCTINL